MTTPVGGTGSGAHDEVLAGEYVLGALAPESMRLVEARLKTDRQFAAMVRRWQENLTEADEAEADPWMIASELRAGGRPSAGDPASHSRNLWRSVAFWRGFGLAVLATLSIYAAFAIENSGGAPAKAVPTALRAIYDPAAGRAAVDAQKAGLLKIWIIETSGQAHLIGELPESGSIALDADMKKLIADGASLAVSPAD